ncbi:autotransporter outer membrane beta-barrel domain-containing protein [Bartonella sp. HY761]|uniref:autotransporter outer membrane beta-barrel domain-containing protein n=1 Tax=Bartonella sp. HY761 TaxID=2979330 RepID=UPI00220A0A50|nr:autotransporter outer membrane beta-barrel domain-containing protein [Bartonella sp. HY761]UXN06491.1 autotransporter outer membrane beta-barrel domain-containing protein [Bartonella sp. HY761]
MNLFSALKFKYSISSIAVTIALGSSVACTVYLQSAIADTITYNGTTTEFEALNNDSFYFPGQLQNNNKAVKTSSLNNNTVTISDTTSLGANYNAPNRVYGGWSQNSNVSNNTVNMTGGIVESGIIGGLSVEGNVDSNTVTISSGKILQDVMGGYSNDGQSTNNKVTITNALIGRDIFGGQSINGNAVNNSVNISGEATEVNGNIAGGNANKGITSKNTVIIENAKVIGSVQGGSASGQITSDNSVIINNGTVDGSVIGGFTSSADATNNTVSINGGQYKGTIIGGYTSGAAATDNKVSITGANIANNIYAGYNAGSDVTTRNELTLNGNTIISKNVYGGFSRTGAVTENKVSITDSSITGNVYGGYSDIGTATQNTVTLNGTNVKISGSIYGGDGRFSGFETHAAGNTLNLNGYRGTVSGIYNFENYNWILPTDVVNGDTLVTITGRNAVDLTNTRHTINMYNDGSRLSNGDKVTMINKTQGSWVASGPYVINQGEFIVYNATLTQQSNGDKPLILTIGSTPVDPTPPTTPVDPTPPTTPVDPTTPTTPVDPTPPTTAVDPTAPNTAGEQSAARLNPQSKSYSEGRAAALAFTSQGSDLIGTSVNGIRAQAFAHDSDTSIVPFIIMNGSSQRNNTGSHVDIKGFNMALGIATGFEFGIGHKTTVGAFFEYGRGTYDTYNSFTNFASVYGDGDSNYKGGGILGRIDFANTGLGRVTNLATDQADGIYLEASIRAGRTSSKFDVGNNMTPFGILEGAYSGSYDSKSSYYGGHVAGGYVFNFDEKQSLDAYGRYLWTHMDGDTVNIGYEKLRFDSATSSRMQLGGRYGYAYNEQFKPYFGATYEYEFDGEIAAKAYEFNLDKPSLGGSTGIFEAGFNIQPITTNKALSLDVNGQGYVGQRQGGGGGVKIKYQF